MRNGAPAELTDTFASRRPGVTSSGGGLMSANAPPQREQHLQLLQCLQQLRLGRKRRARMGLRRWAFQCLQGTELKAGKGLEGRPGLRSRGLRGPEPPRQEYRRGWRSCCHLLADSWVPVRRGSRTPQGWERFQRRIGRGSG